MKLSLEQLKKLVSEVKISRQIQKERNEKKALMEELQQEDIDKIKKQILKPVLQETVASPIHKLHEGLIKNLKQIEGRQKQLEAIEGREAPIITSEVLQAALASSASAIQKKTFDPDKGLDFELLEYYKYLKPSELLDEGEPQELVSGYIKNIDCYLMKWGGQIGNIKDKNSEEYKLLRRKIDGMRAYKDRIKDLVKVLPLAGSGGGTLKNNLIEYKYYSSPDELIKRLELLCAERDIGNDSIEVRNEIMSILDILLKSKIIDKAYHKEMFRKWCS